MGKQTDIDTRYMQRALSLARTAFGRTSPNPMVGAVIVGPDDEIIGEGCHRLCGQAHAEVNAIADARRRNPDADSLLRQSTMYVTLEPCSHYGKTPPCAKLIIETGIPRVIVGASDPFREVSGRGIAMLRDAGIEVITGVLEDECRALNAVFMTAHSLGRPFVTLKWAQSTDGFMDIERSEEHPGAYRFSTPLSTLQVHRLRGAHDAILVGSKTFEMDNPQLTNRLWPGFRRQPKRFVLSHNIKNNTAESQIKEISVDAPENDAFEFVSGDIETVLRCMYADGYTSLLVEGGPGVFAQFLKSGLWDAARIEVAPVRLSDKGRAVAPRISGLPLCHGDAEGNTVFWYSNNPLFKVSNPIINI